MSRSSTVNRESSIAKGFSLIEALAALAVASIALLALLQLQLLGLRTADKAEAMNRAALLAQEKMTEILSKGYPSVGIQSGSVETNGDRLTWQTEVTDARLPLPLPRRQPSRNDRMRKLSVEVTWQKGPGNRRISLTTYVAENGTRGA